MVESRNHGGEVPGAIAVEAAIGGRGDNSVDLGLALGQSSRTRDLAAVQAAPRRSSAWLVVACVVCDFLMVPVFSVQSGPPHAVGAIIAFGILGCVLAQGCLL